MMLASCGNTLSGSYSATYESNGIFGLGKGTYTTTYEFKGNKVVRTDDVTVGGSTTTTVTNGTYEIKDDQIIFTWDKNVETNENGDSVVSTNKYEFSKGDDFIYIGDTKYAKN
jgi:hypothetical protein